MIKHQFSDFSYAVNTDSAKKGNKEILVCFIYNGVEVLKKIYIPEKAGTAYVFEAKKIIDNEMRDGTLATYAHKFVAKNKKKNEPSKQPTTSNNVVASGDNAPKASKPKSKKGSLIALIIVSLLLVAAIVVVVILLLRPSGGDKVAITFDAGEGSWNTEHAKTVSVDKGTKWSEVSNKPTDPTSDSGSFKEWTINNKKVEDTYVFSENTSVFASYNKEITVTFNSGEGSWKDDGTIGDRKIKINAGDKWEKIKDNPELQVNPVSTKEWTGFTIGKEGVALENYYTFTNESSKQTFVASFKNKESTMVNVTIDPDVGFFKGDSHETAIFEVDITTSKTLKNLLDDNPITAPDGYVNTPTWEYCNSTTGAQWEPVDDASTFVIKEATNFRAKFDYRTDITLSIDPRDGTWKDTGKTGSKTFSNIVYGTTWGEFYSVHKDELEIIPPLKDGEQMSFTYFAIGEDEEIVGSSYLINDNDDLHAHYEPAALSKQIKLNAGPEGTIAGQNDITIYAPYGKKWSDIKSAFVPVLNDEYEGLKEFDYFTYNGEEFVGDSVIGENTPSELVAHYKDLIATDFGTDSWRVIEREAKLGVDHLKEKYGNNFANTTRKVELFGNNYNVKVIGTDADTLSDGKTATLTFEFQEVVTCGVSYINYGDTTGEYKTSNLRSYLNETLYNALPHDLQSVIGVTMKTTFEFNSKTTIETEDKLFPLSLTEMGYTIDPQGNPVQEEGDVYTSYSGTVDTRIKYKADGVTPAAYWNRSPFATTHNFAAWGIYSDGQLGNPNEEFDREGFVMTYGLGVAPAFTVGSH